jgi:hypothetical protein
MKEYKFNFVMLGWIILIFAIILTDFLEYYLDAENKLLYMSIPIGVLMLFTKGLLIIKIFKIPPKPYRHFLWLFAFGIIAEILLVIAIPLTVPLLKFFNTDDTTFVIRLGIDISKLLPFVIILLFLIRFLDKKEEKMLDQGLE